MCTINLTYFNKVYYYLEINKCKIGKKNYKWQNKQSSKSEKNEIRFETLLSKSYCCVRLWICLCLDYSQSSDWIYYSI